MLARLVATPMDSSSPKTVQLENVLRQLNECQSDADIQSLSLRVQDIISDRSGKRDILKDIRNAELALKQSGQTVKSTRMGKIGKLVSALPNKNSKKQRKMLQEILRLVGENCGVKVGKRGLCGFGSFRCAAFCMTGSVIALAGAASLIALAAVGEFDVDILETNEDSKHTANVEVAPESEFVVERGMRPSRSWDERADIPDTDETAVEVVSESEFVATTMSDEEKMLEAQRIIDEGGDQRTTMHEIKRLKLSTEQWRELLPVGSTGPGFRSDELDADLDAPDEIIVEGTSDPDTDSKAARKAAVKSLKKAMKKAGLRLKGSRQEKQTMAGIFKALEGGWEKKLEDFRLTRHQIRGLKMSEAYRIITQPRGDGWKMHLQKLGLHWVHSQVLTPIVSEQNDEALTLEWEDLEKQWRRPILDNAQINRFHDNTRSDSTQMAQAEFMTEILGNSPEPSADADVLNDELDRALQIDGWVEALRSSVGSYLNAATSISKEYTAEDADDWIQRLTTMNFIKLGQMMDGGERFDAILKAANGFSNEREWLDFLESIENEPKITRKIVKRYLHAASSISEEYTTQDVDVWIRSLSPTKYSAKYIPELAQMIDDDANPDDILGTANRSSYLAQMNQAQEIAWNSDADDLDAAIDRALGINGWVEALRGSVQSDLTSISEEFAAEDVQRFAIGQLIRLRLLMDDDEKEFGDNVILKAANTILLTSN